MAPCMAGLPRSLILLASVLIGKRVSFGLLRSMKAKKKKVQRAAKAQRKARRTSPATTLKGWRQISAFLSQPVSVAQRWAKDGMPLKRQGRFVTATPEELTKWLGREVGGEPVQVATADLDLSKELKRGLAFVREQKNL